MRRLFAGFLEKLVEILKGKQEVICQKITEEIIEEPATKIQSIYPNSLKKTKKKDVSRKKITREPTLLLKDPRDIRDVMEIMEVPFFSLSKNRIAPIICNDPLSYESGSLHLHVAMQHRFVASDNG